MRLCLTGILPFGTICLAFVVLAAPSIAQTQKSAAVDAYILQLDADALNTRWEAIVALKHLGADAAAAAPRLVPLLAKNIQATADGRIARESERALRAIGEPAVPALIAGLQTDDALVRRRCADLLGVIKSHDAVAALVAALSDEDRNVAVGASVALSRIGRPSVDSLVQLVEESLPGISSDPEVLGAAMIRDTRVRIEVVPGSSYTLQACGCAIDALGQIDDDRIVEPLLQALACDELRVQRSAIQALHRRSMIPGSSADFLVREQVVSRLVAALTTKDQTLHGSLLSLIRRSPRSAMEPVLASLQSPDSDVRQAAFDACGSIYDDPRVARAAMARLAFEDDQLTPNGNFEGVSTAIQYLTSHHRARGEWHAGAVEKLLDLTRHPNSIVKSSAIMAFTERGADIAGQRDPRVIPTFLKLLQDDSQQWVNGMILQALASFQDRQAVPVLLKMLAERQTVIEADAELGRFGVLGVVGKTDRLVPQLCQTLATIGDKSAIPEIQKRIPFNEPFVLRVLGSLGDRDSVPDFVKQLLLKSSSKELKGAAVQALTSCPDSRAIGPLSRELNRHLFVAGATQKTTVIPAEKLTKALAATMDPRAAEALVQSLRKGALKKRSRAGDPRLSALMQMGPVAISALIAAQSAADGMVSEDFERFRRESFSSLLSIVRKYELSTEQRESIERISLALLKASDPLLQDDAVNMLGTIRSKQAVPVLRRRLLRGQADESGVDSSEVRRIRAVLNALVEIDPAVTHQATPPFLTHSSADVRQVAVIAIGKSKHPQAVPLLTKMLDEKDTAVLESTLLQLGIQPDASGADSILDWLAARRGEVESRVVAAAAQSLGMLNNALATDTLTQLTKDDDLQVRINATLALVQLQDDRSMKPLREFLQDSNEEYRVSVMTQFAVLSRFAQDGVCPALTLPAARELLLQAAEKDPFRHVRSGGAAALYGVADDRAVACLLAMTGDRESEVRRLAVSGLAATQNPVRAAVLKAAAADRIASCRITAAVHYAFVHATEAQRDVSPADSAAALSQLSTDRQMAVREAATESFAKLQRIAPQAVEPYLDQLRQLSVNDQSGRVRYYASTLPQSQP